MIVAAHQPNFLPNLAFFSKMKSADLFVIVSNLQFEKHEGWQQRHKIPGPNGDIWLTVPVLGSQNQLIKEVKINNQSNWRKKHQRTLMMIYSKSGGRDILPKILEVYDRDWQRLADLNVTMILLIKGLLDIKTPVVVDEEVLGVKHELLINICKKYGANTYLSGVGVKLYLTDEKMKELEKENIKHKIVGGDLGAIYPYSTIHYLLAEGRNWVRNVI